MEENKANSIFDNENIQAVIKDLDENVLNTLLGDGNNIKDNIAEALEGFLKARKEALDKVDNKPGNVVYSIEVTYLSQLFKFIVAFLEESGYEPITPLMAARWKDKYGVEIEFYDQGE